MKKNFLLFFAILSLTVSSHSQDATTFQSFFGRESTEWYGMFGFYEHSDGELLRFANDTIVDEIRYKKIEAYLSHWDDGGYFESRDKDRDILLREDSATGRLWCRYPDTFLPMESEWSETELLLADMRLSTGDTFEVFRIHESDIIPHIYTVVDTLTVDHRRTIVLQDENDEIKFIEGVGCTNLFDYCMYFYNWTALRCCLKDGELVYRNSNLGGGNECAMSVVSIDNRVTTQDISIHPNPCADKLWITGENIHSVILCDVRGNTLKSTNTTWQPLDVSSLPHGIYFLHFIANNSVFYKTLIKK